MGLRHSARAHPLRNGGRHRNRSAPCDAAGLGEAVHPDEVRHALCQGEGVMNATEIRELTTDDLHARVKELDDQVFRLRIQKSMGQLEAPGKVREVRRDLARLKTILREKELQAAK